MAKRFSISLSSLDWLSCSLYMTYCLVHPTPSNAVSNFCFFGVALTKYSNNGIFIGNANAEKFEDKIASPTSRDAMFLASSDKSWDADSIIACLSGAISIPRIIFVLMFASICLGISEGSWVMAVKPTLNFLPSLAIVENMLGPASRTSLPNTLGASSMIIEMTGLLFSWFFALYLL